MMSQSKIHRMANIAGLILICAALVIVFVDQLVARDLPCPLCLLQRACLIAVGIMLCMNLTVGIKTAHYGFLILAACGGIAISLRQIFLHLAPTDPGYGGLLLGLYFYDWAAISFIIILCTAAIALLLEKGFNQVVPTTNRWIQALMVFFLILILANILSTLLECGLGVCPADPIDYRLLDSVG